MFCLKAVKKKKLGPLQSQQRPVNAADAPNFTWSSFWVWVLWPIEWPGHNDVTSVHAPACIIVHATVTSLATADGNIFCRTCLSSQSQP